VNAAERLYSAADDCASSDGTAATCRALRSARAELEPLEGLLDQVGWEYGSEPPTGALTTDPEWLQGFVEDKLADAIDRLAESHGRGLENQFAVVDFWKGIMDQHGWPLDPPKPASAPEPAVTS
jgi:hypothetical protein